MRLMGALTAPRLAAHTRRGEALAGRLRLEYLGRGSSSWLSLAPSVIRHMALGRAWSGTWVAFAVAALMLAAAVFTARAIVGEPRD